MQADLYPPINLLVFCAETFKVSGPPALIMGQTPETRTEARTETTLVVETSVVAPVGKIVDTHMKPNMDAVRANENSVNAYDFTLTDNISGHETDLRGVWTVGAASTTHKSTLGFSINDLLDAARTVNNPQVNAFLSTVMDAQALRQDDATDEDIAAHYAANGFKTSKVSKADLKKFRDSFKKDTVRPYAAVVKVKPE